MGPRTMAGPFAALGMVVGLLAACGTSPGTSEAPSAVSSAAATIATNPQPVCPNPDGYLCLGRLEAGTYTTAAFTPQLTYTVPAGWQNLEDTRGNFLLLPPGYDLNGVDASASDYIGVYTSVRAENRLCSGEGEAASDEPGVAHTPDAMAAEFARRPGLVTSAPQPASVGGLNGLVMDIRMADDWTGTCFYMPAGEPIVQLIGGVDPSDFDHSVDADATMRLYLLQSARGTLGIEMVDYADGAHLDGYSAIVSTMQFAGN